ncbi:hypothetical protein QL285_080453 [Trifolium repens]|nr:hypothetical protein QL285_080453 [Trifolium repens]
MGKKIVRQQSTWPAKRNRLWFYEDVICVVEKNKRNDRIEAMLLDIPEDKEVQWNEELFEKNGKPHNAYEKERFSSKESCHTQLVKPLEKSKVLSQLIFPNLREICVDDCTNLIEIHDSVGFLDKLLRFSAKGCLIHLKG